MSVKGDIGVIGLAVMGQNLILNMNDNGFKVVAYNRTTSKVDEFLEGAAKGTNIIGAYSLEDLAAKLEKPLIIKKGSDLLSMWLGKTEKNIANAFKEAKEESAVLVFDEVDSFLADRSNADKSWEVTQVNEMLVQMESFDGIFIATTNLMANLDKASLRRFDLKMEFGYLKPEQSWKLFKSECVNIGLSNFFKSYYWLYSDSFIIVDVDIKIVSIKLGENMNFIIHLFSIF